MDVGYTHGTHLLQPMPDRAPTIDYLTGYPTRAYISSPGTQDYYIHPATSGYYLYNGAGAVVSATV